MGKMEGGWGHLQKLALSSDCGGERLNTQTKVVAGPSLRAISGRRAQLWDPPIQVYLADACRARWQRYPAGSCAPLTAEHCDGTARRATAEQQRIEAHGGDDANL